MVPECPDCEVALVKGYCVQCGYKLAAKGQEAPKVPSLCPACNGRLQADGWCPSGNGYYAHMNCPFVCPLCRKRLSWDGGCEACHGCGTGRREDWTFPGDRYELEHGHWMRVLNGPRPACSIEENMAAAGAMARIMKPILERKA